MAPETPGPPDEPSNAVLDALAASRPDYRDRRLLREWLDRPGRGHRDEQWSTATHLAHGGRHGHERGSYGSGRLKVAQEDKDPDDRPEPVDVELPVHLSRGRGAQPRSLLLGSRYAHDANEHQPRALARAFARRFPDPPYRGPRPATRGACVNGPRPCAFTSCRHNLYLDLTEAGGVRLARPDLDPHEIEPEYSCSLDVAERGRHSLEGVGRLVGLTRERIRQIQEVALGKLRLAVEAEEAPKKAG